MMSPLACSDCAENCVHLQLANKGSACKIKRFYKVIMGLDHHKLMYLPPVIEPMMNRLSGKELIIEDAGGCLWPMLLTTVSGGLAFTNGWVPFYRRHNLEEHSLVVFEYKVGTDSLFVHVFSKDGSETIQRNLENSANSNICQSSETLFLEDVLEEVSQQVPDKSGSSDAFPGVFEEDAYVGSPNRGEAMDACGKRKGDCINWKIPRKKRTPVVYVKPGSAQRNHKSVAIGPRSEGPKCVELPIPIPPVPCSRYADSGKVFYLRDPEGRLWPFYNQSEQSVKVLADNWEKLCVENGITDLDECIFEVEEEASATRPFN